ncbi:MAG: biotin--[acetyl-CoA-carboxylase] ligase [Candidatus Cloacimonetes bacterium]|nr:biotin--[acetyl-CoA-carboxylase] ligase [Candidatus Cloacimonadota bacterium]
MFNNLKRINLIYHLKTTSSTMTDSYDIINNIQPLPESFVVIADEQIGGVGRNNNQWVSNHGGLWITYCFKTEGASHQTALLVGVSLHQTLLKYIPFVRERLFIKWPNDIILNKKKLAGILVQAKHGYICIGVGVNTNNERFSLDGLQQPVCISEFLPYVISNSAILKSFLNSIDATYKNFLNNGFSKCREYIAENLYLRGEFVVLKTDSLEIRGLCKGVGHDGAIIIEDVSGELKSYYSGSLFKSGE